MSDLGASGSEDRQLSELLVGGRPEKERAEVERELLLSKLFPRQVAHPKLGRYDVLELLGEGGMGTVFTAYDPRLDRRVAVKLLRRIGDARQQRRARLLREAKALARLSHPNIVTVHEVWEEDGEIYIAMELVQGEDLARWQRGPRPWREVLDAYRQAGAGLAAVHDAGMVYRDFKPHNAIRRDVDGVVKLLDFGLARLGLEPTDPASAEHHGFADDDRLTRPGAIMGTPAYMAPELLEGAPADARSDQFGFCVALWEGLYGELPFVREPTAGGDRPDEPRVEPGRDRGVPGWVRRALERGLARDPAARHPSMHALLRALGLDPAVRRRRALATAAAVVLTVGGALAIAELRVEDPTACVEVRRGWEPATREAARAGVLAGGGDEPAWARLEPRLEQHAEALAQARTQACEAHRRALVPDEPYALQVACLARREAAFTELVERLGRADETAVANAGKAVATLPSPSSCADLEALLAEQPPPEDPTAAARVAELRQELARVATEEAVGSYASAAARAAAVLHEARALDYAPLQAEALVRWGSARMQAGEGDALTQLDEALWLAITTEQRQVAAEAAAKRIFVRVELQDRTADVREAIALAQSLADRPGAADWRIRWTLDNNIGVALQRRSEQSEALAAYESALARIPGGTDEGAFERAMTLRNMGIVQVRLGRPQEAFDGTQQAVDTLATLLGPEHPQVWEFEASRATMLRMGGRYAEAKAALAAVMERFPPSEPPPMWMLYEAAQIDWLRGDGEGARAWCRRARARLDERPGDPTTFWTYWFAGIEARVAAVRGEAGALDELEAMVAVAGTGVIPLLLGRVHALLELGRAAEAEVLVRPLASSTAVAEWDRVVGSVLLGKTLVAQQRWPEAQRQLAELVAADEQRSRLEPFERAEALLALSTAEAGLGRRDEARRRAEQAAAVVRGFDADAPIVRRIAAGLERARREAGAADRPVAPR